MGEGWEETTMKTEATLLPPPLYDQGNHLDVRILWFKVP